MIHTDKDGIISPLYIIEQYISNTNVNVLTLRPAGFMKQPDQFCLQL